MGRGSTGSILGPVYVLLGAILLGVALFAPWYFYHSQAAWSGPGGAAADVADTDFFLIPLPGQSVVQASCPGIGGLPALCSASVSYSAAGLNNTGRVVNLTLGVAAASFFAAALSGALGVVLRTKPRSVFPELFLAFAAIALAVTATVVFAVLLPGAFAHDLSPSQRVFETTGPWSSFTGSTTYIIPVACLFPGCAAHTATWGPSVGWSFSVAAVPILLVGAAMMIRFRHDVESVGPSEVTASSESKSGPPKSTT